MIVYHMKANSELDNTVCFKENAGEKLKTGFNRNKKYEKLESFQMLKMVITFVFAYLHMFK